MIVILKAMHKLILFLIIPLYATGQNDDIIVRFYPSGNLSIGQSIDINNPNATKQDAITYQSLSWLDGGSPDTRMKASLATNMDELYQKLNLDYNIQGEVKIPVIGGGKAEFDLKYEVEKEFTDNNLYYVIQAYNDFGRQGLQGVDLKANLKQLLNQNKFPEFIRQAGTHYVVRQRRASNIYALISISRLNKMTKKSLSLMYNSNVNINISDVAELSEQQKLQFKNLIKTSNKLASVKIEYYASGTSGLSKLSGIFPQSPDDLTSILTALSAATASVTQENSTPIEYHLASFHPFGLNLPAFDQEKSSCLSKLTNKKLTINFYLNKIQNITVNHINSEFKNYYLKKMESLTNMLKIVQEKEKSCIENGNCCQNDSAIESVQWLEDLITVDASFVVPEYADAYKSDGSKVGKILKSLRLVVEGNIENDEYYCCMRGYFLDNNLNPIKTDLRYVSNTNPTLSDTTKEEHFVSRDFLYVIDLVNIDFEYNTRSQILYNSDNLKKIQDVIEKLRRNNYFIEATSRDNLRSYFDIGAFDFNDVKTFINN
jgi:DNA-directed RNA polymerase subunit F